MVAVLIARLGVIVMLAHLLSGCWFSANVSRAFFGNERYPYPTSPERSVTGIFLTPFAVALDVATFPIQGLILVIAGDDAFDNVFLYVQSDDGHVSPRVLSDSEEQALLAALTRAGIQGTGLSGSRVLYFDSHWQLLRIEHS